MSIGSGERCGNDIPNAILSFSAMQPVLVGLCQFDVIPGSTARADPE
jgi:hypothetical protein